MSLRIIYFFIVIVMKCRLYSAEAPIEQVLTKDILLMYDTRIRPSIYPHNPNQTLPVIVDIYLTKMLNINEFYGTADIGFWIGIGWNDSRLSWDPTYYVGVKKLIIPSKQVWLPDLKLLTGHGVIEESMIADDKYSVIVRACGSVYYRYPVNKVIRCIHKAERSSLSCSFKIGSWTLPNDMMILNVKNKVIDTSMLGTNIDTAYKIKSANYKVKQFAYPDVPDEYHDVIKVTVFLQKE